MGVKAGYQGLRANPLPPVVQPQRGFAGYSGQAVAGEMGVRMREAGGVIPHFAGVGNLPPEGIGHPVMHAAIGIGMGTVQHAGGLRAIHRPVGAALLVATVDAAGGQHHRRSREADFFTGGFVNGQSAADVSCLVIQFGNAVLVQQCELAAGVLPV